MNDMQTFMQRFQKMKQNPAQYVMQNYGIDSSIANNPDAIIRKFMREGKLSQAQYNYAYQMAMQMQNNPMFSQFFK
jgi:hypothetical protein